MKKWGNKIKKVIAADAEKLIVKLAYDDGTKIEVSLANIFAQPRGLAAEVMRGGLFERCYVESGALAWLNGLELCPDALLMDYATPVKQTRVSRRASR
ncbi:MAG: DUF2442 domain-containing protein [Deltaproteobacteria bacterium]|nr:DUF2442 domain-containing protein [Deltaproteobacteria bacterium]